MGGVRRTEDDCEGVSVLSPATEWLLYPRTKVATHPNSTLCPQTAVKKWGGRLGTQQSSYRLSNLLALLFRALWGLTRHRTIAWMGVFFPPPNQNKSVFLLFHWCYCTWTGLRLCVFLAEERTGEEVVVGAVCQGGFGGAEGSWRSWVNQTASSSQRWWRNWQGKLTVSTVGSFLFIALERKSCANCSLSLYENTGMFWPKSKDNTATLILLLQFSDHIFCPLCSIQ